MMVEAYGHRFDTDMICEYYIISKNKLLDQLYIGFKNRESIRIGPQNLADIEEGSPTPEQMVEALDEITNCVPLMVAADEED